jgi:glycine cleavage system aminomethyltransferase T/glycine/D-amino acid oxidase-like deaminating enzyme
MTGPRVVVIGAGVVGAALADELSTRGWTDITVLDQGTLPSAGGSSSHAPGLVFQTNSSRTMTALARYTIQKLASMDCFAQVGSLEVATTPQRLAELHRRHGWLTAAGGTGHVLDPAETLARHDLLDPDTVLGGLWVPEDGVARAVRAVGSQLALARERGVRVLDRHEVLEISTAGGRVSGVVTARGTFPADVVVCAAGIWGPKMARLVGVELPLSPLAHQLAWTEQVPALRGQEDEEIVRPILRHQDADLYVRERFDRLGVGYYGHRPLPIDAAEILSVDDAPIMPSVLPFTPDDFVPAWDATQALLPATRETKIGDAVNGLFSFTTDNFPLLGESSTVPGLWFAEAVWVTHSAGVGRAVAEWLVDGYSSTFDLHECDVNRFEPHQLAPAYVLERDCRNYIEVYDILHPLQPMESPRPLRTTPFYPRQQALGASFLEAAGWERPQWYDANAALSLDEIPTPGDWAARYWSPIVGAEALATRTGVAMFDMTGLKRVEVSGPGATAFLQWVTTGDVDKSVGAVTYCLLLDHDGGIRSDITVARLGPELYQIGVNGLLDVTWLRRHAPATVTVVDTTAGTCCVGVWGPRARDLVQPLATMDLGTTGLRYFRGTRGYVGNVPVVALRLSYVGELGWELYTTADLGLKLWDTLWDAGRDVGLIAAGRGAFTSLRLEKGYRSFGTDMTYEHDPFAAGLGFAVKLDKGDFLGRDAVLSRRGTAPKRLVCLTLDEVVMGKEPVYHDGVGVGYVTSAAWGYTVGSGIAYAWLPASLAEPGQTVHIGYFGRRIPATVAAEPLYDPTMSRLRD